MKSENSGPPPFKHNSRIVAKNAAWSGLEVVFAFGSNFITTVLVARIIGYDDIGKARLGTYQYIVWLTTVTLAMGSFGLPATTRKYMAEYLNNGKPEVARATYLSTLKIQTYLSLCAAAVGFLLVCWLGDRHYFLASMLLVLAIVPRLISTIPSQANNACEVTRRNTTASMAGIGVMTPVSVLSLLLGWDFVGLSAAVLAGACLECALKLRGVEQWLGGVPRGAVAPDLRKRMLTYSGQELALLLLNLLVWDRSDIMILKALNPDRRQIVFFSIPFSLAERGLGFPTLFAGALGFTVMAQYGRDRSRLGHMTVDSARYSFLIALPLLVGVACVSQPLIFLLYPTGYAPMVSTLVIVALMAIPKALVTAPTFFLQSFERQGFLVVWGCVCGLVDLALDVLLVRRYGANGAAFANGTAQTLAALGIWIYVWRKYHLDLRLGIWGRIVISGAIMAAGVLGVLRVVPGTVGLFVSVAVGAALWIIGLRLTAAVSPEDAARLLSISGQFPAAVRPRWRSLIVWLVPSVSA
jgi:O-antigen/teichoic acid export membrane protein